jgi:competence protein ComEC
MQGMRNAIDARIRTALEGDNHAIATALLTGRRDAITPPVNDAMFISGLGHVLSISGYHMAVVAGVVFFAVRALLALIPGLTVTFPIKKWSAAAALAAATFYLLLSGAEVATQRSYFMTAVVLIAVMVDRRAITFRTLAIAAMIVLIAAPESLVHPSFQMSFAATLGLVALIQIGMPRLFATPDNSAAARAALWGGREIMTLALASLVAGLATTPYAAFHFHRVTPYGVLANLAAMPVVSGIVMPAGLMGLIAAPFGLDRIFWEIMGLGIDWMIEVAVWVAALPGAIGRMAAFGTGPLLLASAGIVLLGLLRTPLRWAGGVVVVLSTVWALSGDTA